MNLFGKEKLNRLIDYIVNRLYFSHLYPIEKSVYLEEKGRKVIHLNKECFKKLFEYVDTAYRLIKIFNPEMVSVLEYSYLEKEVKEQLQNALEDKFIYSKEVSIAGRVYDPFAYWTQELYIEVASGNLKTKDIKKVEICEHGDIKFIDKDGKFFGAVNYKTGVFRCGECKKPRDIFSL